MTSKVPVARIRALILLPSMYTIIIGALKPKLVTPSDSQHQSAPDQHGHEVEHGTRRVSSGVGLRNARILVQNDVELPYIGDFSIVSV